MNYDELIAQKREEIWRVDQEIKALKALPPDLPIKMLYGQKLTMTAETRGQAFRLMTVLRPILQKVERDTVYYYWLISSSNGKDKETLVWETRLEYLGQVTVWTKIERPLIRRLSPQSRNGQASYANLPLGTVAGTIRFKRVYRFAEDWESWIAAYDLAKKFYPSWLNILARDLRGVTSIRELHTSDVLIEYQSDDDCPYYFRLERSRLGLESGDTFENQYDIVVVPESESGLAYRCELEARQCEVIPM